MDLLLVWTAIGVIVAVVGGIVGVIRKGDQTITEDKFIAVDKQIGVIQIQVAAAAQREEVMRIEARFERDISDLRNDQKNGFAEIRKDIKDLRVDLMDALRSQEAFDRRVK